MVFDNDVDRPSSGSHLFMLRLWLEDLGSGQTDWRGKVQHINSGEARYFRDWLSLEAFLEDLIHKTSSEGNPSTGSKTTDREPG